MPLLFADECVAGEIVQELRAHGLDVAYAKEICRGSPDPEILRIATEGGRVLTLTIWVSASSPCAKVDPQRALSSCRATRFQPAFVSAMPRSRSGPWAMEYWASWL